MVLYMDSGCLTCDRSRSLLRQLALVYPDLDMEIVEANNGQPLPAEVIAVPTFVLQGRVISVGNPTMAELIASVEEAFSSNA